MPTAENENMRIYDNPRENAKEFRFNPAKFNNPALLEIAEYHATQSDSRRSMFCVGEDNKTIVIPKIPPLEFEKLNKEQKRKFIQGTAEQMRLANFVIIREAKRP